MWTFFNCYIGPMAILWYGLVLYAIAYIQGLIFTLDVLADLIFKSAIQPTFSVLK